MQSEEILRMVKDGTISVEEGVRLLEALNSSNNVAVSDNKVKMLRIYVDAYDDEDGPQTVRVNIPISLLKVGKKLSNHMSFNGIDVDDYVDMDIILAAIDSGEIGEIVSVDSKEAKVRMVIE